MFLFARDVTNIYLLLPTKENKIKWKSWQDTLIVFSCQFITSFSRLFSATLLTVLLRYYLIIPIIIYFLISAAVLWRKLSKDKSMILLAIVTNIFAPCIVLEEQSSFFAKSSLISTILHISSLVLFYLPTFAPEFKTMFQYEYDNFPLILKDREKKIYFLFGTFVLLFINIPLIHYLKKYLDPVFRLKASLCCSEKDPICGVNWPPKYNNFLETVKSFIQHG